MKIIIKLKNLQHTTEADNISINCINGDIVISDGTDTDSVVASKKKPKKAWIAKYENPKLAIEAIKLLKLGYSITQVAKSLDIHYMHISRINNGEQHYREDFPDEKFPIQDNKSCKGMYSRNVWRRVPVTFCKECGEPIPVAELVKDPHCEYCPECASKYRVSIIRKKNNTGFTPVDTNRADSWRKIPITLCKECRKRIPVVDLLEDPQCEYCQDCRAKHKEE